MMRFKPVLALTAAILLVGACRSRAAAPPGAPADEKPVAVAIKAPSTLAEIADRRKELAKEIVDLKLGSATQPATTQPIEPATRPADVATNLWLRFKAYDALLEKQALARERLNELSAAGIKKLKDEIDELQSETKKLGRKLAANRAYAEVYGLDEVAERYQKLNQEHDAQVKAQTARIERLGEFAQRRRQANAKVSATRKRLDKALAEFAVRATTAKAGPERDEILFARRLAELNHEMALAELETLNLEEALLNQEQRREKRRLAALQPYVQTLRRWMNALEKAAAEGERARIQWELDNAKTDWEKRYWTIAMEIQETYEWFERYDNPTRDRFPESRFGKLEGRIARGEKYWRTFLDSLPRRAGQEVLNRYREVREKLQAERDYYRKLHDWLDLSIDEREAVLTRRDKILESIDNAREGFSKAPTRPGDERVEELESQLDGRVKTLTDQMNTIESLQNELIDRLTQSIDKLGGYIDGLDRSRSRMYWSYLTVRDQGLVRLAWRSIRSEWADGAASLRSRVRGIYVEGGEQLDNAQAAQWAVAGLLFVGAIPLSWSVRRRRLRRAVRLEGELIGRIHDEGIEAAGFSERFQLAMTRLIGEAALPVLPLLALLACGFILRIGGMPLRLAVASIGFLLGISLCFDLVGALFLRGRPRLRLIRCSNTVARYYRRSIKTLLFATIVAVPLPLLFYLMDVMPATRTYLWQVYKSAALLIVLLFLLRKRLVLKVVGRPENLRARWLYSLVAGLYPLIPLGVFGLLVLEVLGYGALTGYLIRNTVLTFAILLAVTMVTSYAADLAGKYRRALEGERLAKRDAEGPAEGSGRAGRIGAGQDVALIDEAEAGEGEFLIGLAALLFSWAARLTGLVLILGVWGITLVEIQAALTFPLSENVTLWRLTAAVAAIVVGVLLSRSLRSVLSTRVYPAYPQLDRGARAAVNTLLHYFFVVLAVYAAMQLLYVNLGAVTVLLGTLGLGLGLGLQPLFINFISGLMIFFERHIKVGDIVEVGDKMGEVTAIRMRSTSIKTFDNIDMVIPNGEFITKQVVNWSLQDRRIRGHLNIGVAYGSDVMLVRDLLLQVAHEHPMVLDDPAPVVWFTDFGDNALTFRLLVWFGDLSHRITSLTDLRFAIDKRFAEHGITIPFPQRTLSMIDDKPLRVELTRPETQAGPGPEEP